MASQISEVIDQHESFIFIAASKGVADSLYFLFDHASQWKSSQRQKFKLMISLSGVNRGSNVAEWISRGNESKASLVRGMLSLYQTDPLRGIAALSRDPWEGRDRKLISKKFKNLKWLSVSMLPSGENAYENLGLMSNFIRNAIHESALVESSPGDSLVETAATLLPPGTDIPQWIVRGFGPHALALGHYLDGTLVAPVAQSGRKDLNPDAGPEILNAYMRALSQDFLR